MAKTIAKQAQQTKAEELSASLTAEVSSQLREALARRKDKAERRQRWLVKKSGVSLNTVSQVLNQSNKDILLSTLGRMALALDCKVELRLVPNE